MAPVPRSPRTLNVVVLTIISFTVLILIYQLTARWQDRKLNSVCVRSVAANITDRLGMLWTRNSASHDAHTAQRLANQLGTVDRVDVYQQVSDLPGKSTVLFAYRKSTCPDWNRENPDKLFHQPAFHKWFPEGGVFIDIGACYGDTAVPMSILADQVIAFEPNPLSFEVLKLNALMNPGLNIHPHNLAAGDGKAKDLSFTYGGDMCNGGIPGDWKKNSEETALKVRAVDVPSFLMETYGEATLRNISVVKVDAEGFDAKIVKTLEPLLKHTRFLLLVEWFDYYVTTPPHGNEGPDGVHPGAKELFDAIASLGMVPYNPDTGERVPGPQNKYKLPDLLCKSDA